ncbi:MULTISPECIES: OprD family porin [Pseudomonas]|uniref:Outer membrane porin, OprD family n=1 Tax=Pseudomonas guariconensis TaxID=1288410 RepID=A0AAX0VVM6_9PSED|nr:MULTISPECIES: OprD family porin [Pseudomonas]MBH3357900.1 OprD family porin [Pseudomonas guariconensis]MCO7621667.1 OprD family porin [Pseudomonas guariconensis]MDM9595595.1 OprD family porin [Pseudomonas guariconensis]MDM9608425.1 OprD family porin [Pseudomonas guariconensis]MDM9613382.1 OprD family porin [Pseudomonas guariconensis]
MLSMQPQAFAPTRSLSARPSAIASALALAGVAPLSQAAFFEDSTATFETRNMYFNRDFRDGTSSQQSKRDEWAQGFMLNFESGYTDGTVGFGLDALGMLGIKLDSSPDRTDTGLLPTHDDGKAADEYSKLGLTGKIKVSNTELKVGTLIPELPTLQPNDGRILPQTFEGGLLTSKELKGLTFTGGRLEKAKDRNDTNWEDLALNNKNGRFGGTFSADNFDLAGLDYQFTDRITGSYHFAELDDIYRQHFIGMVATQPWGPGTFGADLRLAVSDDAGQAKAGNIDNTTVNGMLSYALGGHKVSAAYQHLSGDSAFPYVDGADPYLVNFVQINDFAGADERSWQARYDYNFAALGIPGLTFMTRYISGDNVSRADGGEGKEWERNTEFKYVVQSGPLKDVAVRLRNATFRSNFARDADEVRLLVSYSVALW